MTYSFRPAVRENTPLIVGIAGPTKSGKTMSALRLAVGLAEGGQIVMLNAEGPRGHQYAGTFTYSACELELPYRPTSYTDALRAAAKLKPKVVIIDSGSHMHDGPGGVLEWHEEELTRMGGQDQVRRDKANFTAWVKPKAAVNEFIYEMLGMKCAVILCLRAKEKIKITPGKPPIDLGWQPIVDERVAFETLFTLMLPPHSKGVPDLSISDMREPFDAMVPNGKPIDEQLGKALAAWAKGGAGRPVAKGAETSPASAAPEPTGGSLFPPEPLKEDKPKASGIPGIDHPDERQAIVLLIDAEKAKLERQPTPEVWDKICEDVCGTTTLDMADSAALQDLLGMMKGLLAKDRESIARAKRIMSGAAA